jgi:tetratricopeptide (TPR) repeat protein
MAKDKGKSKNQDEDAIDQDEVVFEEETGQSSGETAPKTLMEKYRNLWIIGGAAVLLTIAYFVYQWSQRDNMNQEAQAEMIMPVVNYERDSMALAINGDGQQSLLDIVEDYGATDAGNLARYYLGTAYLKSGNLEDGISALEEYKKGRSLVSAAAYGALGYAYEQKNEFEEAAKNYQEAARTPKENSYSTPFYLMQAGRNLESAGKAEEALEVYQRIREKYPLSDQVKDGSVDRYIARLSQEDIE